MWQKLMNLIQSQEFCGQSCHFFAGISIVLAAGFYYVAFISFLFLQIWALPKELLFDSLPFGENHGKPDWLDLFFYELGGLVAVCYLYFYELSKI